MYENLQRVFNMIKFVPKQKKHIMITNTKEKFVYTLKYILRCPGKFKDKHIQGSVWKYLMHFHSYYKAIASLGRIRTVCLFSGRTRGLYRSFQLSRMQIREKIKMGAFLGISKSSW